MKNIKKIIPSIVAASLMMSFIACNNGDSTAPGASALSSIQKDGTAVDGYIKVGTACLDLNLDNTCNVNEPTTTTNGSGIFSLNVTAAHQIHDNYETAPVIVYGGTDIDTNSAFTGLMKAPFHGDSSAIIVSPLSTMLEALIQNGKTENEAKSALAKVLGISSEDILKDPVALYTTKPELAKAALTIQKAIEILAEANIAKSTTQTSTTKEFAKIYAQLADATSTVAGDSTLSKSFSSVIKKAKEDGKLTGGAADAVESISVIEEKIKNGDYGKLSDLALEISSKSDAIKSYVKEQIDNDKSISKEGAQSASQDAQENTRIITVKNFLHEVNATDIQIENILEFENIVSLTEITNTTEITKEILANTIRNSTGDSSYLALADKIFKETEVCENVNPINGLCEDGPNGTGVEDEEEVACENVNPINGLCEDGPNGTGVEDEEPECQVYNPITGGCEDVAEEPVDEEEEVACENVNPINGLCEDGPNGTGVENEEEVACENVNPINGLCEDGPNGTGVKEEEPECQVYNPITGGCEDVPAQTTGEKTTKEEVIQEKETTGECQNVNPITGGCEDITY